MIELFDEQQEIDEEQESRQSSAGTTANILRWR
jgi:hypothetical protein